MKSRRKFNKKKSSVGRRALQVVVQAYISCLILCNVQAEAGFKINVYTCDEILEKELFCQKKKKWREHDSIAALAALPRRHIPVVWQVWTGLKAGAVPPALPHSSEPLWKV